jgi:branched-subunit amino acid ABC-type transport system permease component
MPVSWTSIIEFALFIVVLIAFPRGLFNFIFRRS